MRYGRRTARHANIATYRSGNLGGCLDKSSALYVYVCEGEILLGIVGERGRILKQHIWRAAYERPYVLNEGYRKYG